MGSVTKDIKRARSTVMEKQTFKEAKIQLLAARNIISWPHASLTPHMSPLIGFPKTGVVLAMSFVLVAVLDE